MTIKDLVHLMRNDRMIVLGTVTIIVALVAMILLGDEKDADGSAVRKENTERKWGYDGKSGYNGKKKVEKYYAVESSRKVHLVPFDPNTADSTVLLQLGLAPWQVRSIYRYRAEGGVYTCPEDFARLYGLTVKKFRELRPYIRISPDYRPAGEVYGSRRGNNVYKQYNDAHSVGKGQMTNSDAKGVSGIVSGGRYRALTDSDSIAARVLSQQQVKKLKDGETIALNTADTLTLRRVPGIGPFFARKIFRYREKLGGFVSVEQLKEIEDFPLSALPYFTISSVGGKGIRKININKASFEELRNHPYISYLMARQIRDYRKLRGRISDLSDFRLLSTFPEKTIEKLRPYVEY